MANIKANGILIRKLRRELKINSTPASQMLIASLSADRVRLKEFKGEDPPLWINAFGDRWLSNVETRPGDSFDENLLKSLAYILGTSLEAITVAQHKNPYKGPKAFGIRDAKFFGGRKEEARLVFKQLQSHNLVGIIGASGSGKSSLAFAGVCPLIAKEQTDWEMLSLRIGEKPLESLFYALDQWLFPSTDEKLDRPTRISAFENNLKQGDKALYHYLTGARQDTEKTPVLLLDQWEDLYTLCESQSDQNTFLQNLITAVENDAVRVLITVRADFYDQLLLSPPPFFERLKPNLIDLQPMKRCQLQEAIEKPTEGTGFKFADGLVGRLLKDVGPDQGHLPILQIALSELWANRDIGRNMVGFEVYEGFGGLQHIISTHANNVLENILSPEGRRIARLTLPSLVHLGGHGNDVKLPLPLLQFGPEQQNILRRLSEEDCRLLTIYRSVDTINPEREIEYVELAHEELIRSWPVLRTWLDDNLEFHLQRSNLQASYKRYLNNNQDTDFLIPEGKRLDEARRLLNEYGRPYLGDLKSYIERSIEKWEKIHDEGLKRERRQKRHERKLRKQAERAAQEAKSRLKFAAIATCIALFGAIFSVYGLFAARFSEAQSAHSYARILAEGGEYRNALATLYGFLPSYEMFRFLVPPELASSLFHILTTSPIQNLQHKKPVLSAVFSSDGKRVTTLSRDGTERIWDVATGTTIGNPTTHRRGIKPIVYSQDLNSDEKRLVTKIRNNNAHIWDKLKNESVGDPIIHEDDIYSAVFSRDGNRIVTASRDGTARIWNGKTGKPVGKPMVHRRGVHSATFSWDGHRIVTASHDGTARIWDGKTGEPLGSPMIHDDAIHSAAFSRDGNRIVTASRDGSARIWNSEFGNPIGGLLERGKPSNSVVFSPDSRHIVIINIAGTARIWDIETGKTVGGPMKHDGGVHSVAFSRDGRRIVTASIDGTARIWDGKNGKKVSDPMKHDASINTAFFSRNGRRIVTASDDGTARVWDGKFGKIVGAPLRHEKSVQFAVFSRDGRRIVTASDDDTARIWDVEAEKLVGAPMEHPSGIISSNFSLDGSRVITASFGGTRIWDAKNGKPVGRPKIQYWTGKTLAFSPNMRRIIEHRGEVARIWDIETRKLVGAPMNHNGIVQNANFSQDGRRVVTTSGRIARVWDAETGKPIGNPILHEHLIQSAVFSQDGRRIATNSDAVRIWNVEIDYRGLLSKANRRLEALGR